MTSNEHEESIAGTIRKGKAGMAGITALDQWGPNAPNIGNAGVGWDTVGNAVNGRI